MGVRFAPSPTGRFHLGNLRTAWVAGAWARALGQPLVFRFEDIDLPRVQVGALEQQLADLAALGVVPHSSILQSERRARHWELFERARREGAIYPCFCSRREVTAALASAPHAPEAVYHGRCRAGAVGAQVHETLAWRFRGADPSGAQDFLVARTGPDARAPAEAGFVPSYHWACAIDDLDGRYTLLVRGWDLEPAAHAQRAVQAWVAGAEGLAFLPPAIFHAAMVVGNGGERLEKRSRGVTLPELAAEGWDPARLLAAFRASFEGCAGFAPGRLWGEATRALRVAELLR